MKSNQTLKILFWHRKSKADSKGFAPIICRISIDGKDAEFSTSQKVHLSEWDIKTKKVIGSINSKKINSALNLGISSKMSACSAFKLPSCFALN